MNKRLAKVFLIVALLGVSIAPATAAAENVSVTQVITVTAVVAPMRSIVVNDQGQMIKIYSNTDQDITPKVYLNTAPGPQKTLTPELQAQYAKIISTKKNLIGVEIPVSPPKTTQLPSKLQAILGKTVSTLPALQHRLF